MSLFAPRSALVALGLAVAACGTNVPQAPADADTTYGAAVNAADALPVPTVAAETARYVGRRVTVDGRIGTVAPNGCTVYLSAGSGPPLRVDAARDSAGTCAWRIPAGSDGIAVAPGTLRAEGDTLRLSATGVQVTPVQITESDS